MCHSRQDGDFIHVIGMVNCICAQCNQDPIRQK